MDDLASRVTDLGDLHARLDRVGFTVVPNGVGPAATERLIRRLGGQVQPRRGGVRGLLRKVPAVAELLRAERLRAVTGRVLGQQAFVVRAILFDKSPDSNWKVTWHQDRTIAVKERLDLQGYSAWSRKEDVWHVQPPASVLEDMLTVRVHLDPCGADNGPLRVIPGSHRGGRLSMSEIGELHKRGEEVVCEVPAGGLLAMRPLLLHASSAARTPDHRRVVHLELAAAELPGKLEWYERHRLGERAERVRRPPLPPGDDAVRRVTGRELAGSRR